MKAHTGLRWRAAEITRDATHAALFAINGVDYADKLRLDSHQHTAMNYCLHRMNSIFPTDGLTLEILRRIG